jgi:hypothetical protein
MLTCFSCSSHHIKLNDTIHNGKQNHLCKDCTRKKLENHIEAIKYVICHYNKHLALHIYLILPILFAFYLLNSSVVLAQIKNTVDTQQQDITLPDFFDKKYTSRAKKIAYWETERRKELIKLFEQNVYGEVPPFQYKVEYKTVEEGKTEYYQRKQVAITFYNTTQDSTTWLLLLITPLNAEKVPVFVGLNFFGNHTVMPDENILLSDCYSEWKAEWNIFNFRQTELSRGVRYNRWAILQIVKSGYGLATVCYQDIEPDTKNDKIAQEGIRYFSQSKPTEKSWGAVAAWSFGLSTIRRFLDTQKEIDKDKIIVIGHSRLGKAALWAGALDTNFAMVISNNSGCTGAAISRRKVGETVEQINRKFPHWFCTNYKKYNNKEEDLPIDQHQLLALIAPRPLYVASAEKDINADPEGEWIAAKKAGEIYELYQKKGLDMPKMPQKNTPDNQNNIGYHLREGEHDITFYDWYNYIQFADRHFKNKR